MALWRRGLCMTVTCLSLCCTRPAAELLPLLMVPAPLLMLMLLPQRPPTLETAALPGCYARGRRRAGHSQSAASCLLLMTAMRQLQRWSG